MSFPVAILAERGDRILFHVERAQLLGLIARGGVIGVGSRNRIKRIRVNDLIAAEAEQVFKESAYSREALKFTYDEDITNRPCTLKRAVGSGYQRWPDDARFNPFRFNPDQLSPAKVYAPIAPPLRGSGM